MTFSSRLQRSIFILERIGKKSLYKALRTFNKRLQPFEKYCIRKGYHHAKNSVEFDDTINTDQWQKRVYEVSASLMRKNGYHSIIDVGCGSAFKLMNMFPEFETTGIETRQVYEWLVKNYPHKKWLLFDSVTPGDLISDLVICSDVIEHVEEPDKLMDFLNEIHFHQLILSTPERESVAGLNDYGPPENPSHYREWNAEEFKQYVSCWFKIVEQLILPDKSVTQVVICQKRNRYE